MPQVASTDAALGVQVPRQRQNSVSCAAQCPALVVAGSSGRRTRRRIHHVVAEGARGSHYRGRWFRRCCRRARSSSTCAARCMPHSTGVPRSAAEWRQHQHPLVSGGQIGILVASIAAVDVPAVADAVGRDTEAVGRAGSDGIHQVDSAVAVEHDRFTGRGVDRRDEHPSFRPALTGQPAGDGGAPPRLPGAVRRRIHLERRRTHPAAHVGRILSGSDDSARPFHVVGRRRHGERVHAPDPTGQSVAEARRQRWRQAARSAGSRW